MLGEVAERVGDRRAAGGEGVGERAVLRGEGLGDGGRSLGVQDGRSFQNLRDEDVALRREGSNAVEVIRVERGGDLLTAREDGL
jgi:hypothetical protein